MRTAVKKNTRVMNAERRTINGKDMAEGNTFMSNEEGKIQHGNVDKAVNLFPILHFSFVIFHCFLLQPLASSLVFPTSVSAHGAQLGRARGIMRLRTYFRGIGFVLGFVATVLLSSGCSQENERTAAAMTGGDPQHGKRLIRTYGCHSCHTIPGVQGADGLVGPPLVGIAKRVYIAGRLPNTPENMILWLQQPQAFDPQTAMPNMGVTEADARDMAGYLYTLTTNTSALPSIQFYNWAQPLLAIGKWVSRGSAPIP